MNSWNEFSVRVKEVSFNLDRKTATEPAIRVKVKGYSKVWSQNIELLEDHKGHCSLEI